MSEHVASSERVDLREFSGAFVVEAEELVVTANALLLDIEVAISEGTSRPRAVRGLLRALHTIKGLASMIGVEPIVEIAHALETLVRAADHAGGSLRHAAVEIALQGVGAMSDRVRAIAEHRAVEEPPDGLLEAITSTEVGAAVSITATAIPPGWEACLSPSERQQLALALQTRAPVWTLSYSPGDASAARGITITTVRAGLDAIGEIVKITPRSIAATAGGKLGVAFDILLISRATQRAIAEIALADLDQVIAMVLPAPTSTSTGPVLAVTDPLERIERDDHVSTLGRAVVRVDLARLDDVQDQLSLLIVSRFRLEREIASLAQLGHDVRRLHEVVRIQGLQLRDLRRAILRARMVRVAEVLEPLTLLIRSLTRSGHRLVQLEVEARDVELDKTVADRLLPALIHLVRNAVDHGIESPEQRVAAGKPRTGTVRVSCLEVAGNYIEVVVRDDGLGIDRAEIARRANRPIGDGAALLAVLTSAGFSTRDVATTTSGRGLGMDIVHRIVVGDLGGEISMTTDPGAGTAFMLRVPVTISVMDVVSFQCGPQTFVVPALVVEEIIEVLPNPGATMSSLSVVARRDHAIPLVSLGAILAIDSGARARKALVVRRHGAATAFAVDRVIGRQEVVVRSIDDPLVNVPGIAGATDLGDGHPTLVLDLNELGIIARERAVS